MLAIYIKSLNGFPGPFLKYINEMLTSEEILEMMKDKKDRTIYLKECLTYATPDGFIKQFLNIEEAKISNQAMGIGSTFDRIVIFKGDKYPKAMNNEEKNIEHFKSQLSIYDDMAKFLMEVKENEKY